MRLVSLLVVGAVVGFAAPANAMPDQQDAVEAYPRDVFEIVGSTLRNPDADTDPAAPLFNVAGVGLDVTWGAFSSATAIAIAKQIGGHARPRTDVRIDMAGLVPGGLYSLFYITLGPDSENPLCPGVERSLPLYAFHPSGDQPDPASFYADENGLASFHGRVDGALLDAQQLYLSVIWHAYGESYGDLPNAGEYLTQGENCRSSFGEDSMRQLLITQKFS